MLDIKNTKKINDYSFIKELLYPWISQRREINNMLYAKNIGIESKAIRAYFKLNTDSLNIEEMNSQDIIELRKQLKITEIIAEAVEQLILEDKECNIELNNINHDWEAIFLENAGNCSYDELKELWVHLLKSEITGVSTSKKTMHIMKYMNKDDAILLKQILQYSLSFRMVEMNGTDLMIHGVTKSGIFPPDGSKLERGYPFEIDYEGVGRLINLGIIESRETSKLKLSGNQEYYATISNKLLKVTGYENVELPFLVWSREGYDFFNIEFSHKSNLKVEEYYQYQLGRINGLNVETVYEFNK